MGILGYEEVRRDKQLILKETMEGHILTESQFSFFKELTLNLPGHGVTQMLFSIGLVKTNSVVQSLIGVLFYYLPSLILILALSQLDVYFNRYYAKTIFSPSDDFLLFYMAVLIVGISQAVLGLLIHNSCHLFSDRATSLFNMSIMIISALLNLMTDKFSSMVIIMILAGIFTMINGEKDNIFEDKQIDQIVPPTVTAEHSRFLGIPSFVTFLFFFICSALTYEFLYYKSETYPNLYLGSTFFLIGTFTTTGGHSIIPLVLSSFGSKLGALEILKGYAFVSILPGPMFNLAAFIGGVMNGILSGIISVIFITLPGILLLMTFLANPNTLKYNSNLRNFLIGINLASIGFNFAAAYKLYKAVALTNPYVDPIFSTFNIAICFLMLFSLNMAVPIVLLIGGAIIMFYSLVYLSLIHI